MTTKQELKNVLDAALAYAALGWPVFPIYGVTDGQCDCGTPDCPNAGKHPHRLAPSGHLSATTDADRITEIWSTTPTPNIGINLEAAGLLVVGPDSPEWLARFEAQGLPPTVVVQSGGGEGHKHFYFRRPEGCPITRLCRSGEYDIISNGYAVAAPSRHKSGGNYQLLTGLDTPIPEAPGWAVQMLKDKEAARTDFEPLDPDEPPVPLTGTALQRWNGQLLEYKSNGDVDRSETLIKIAELLVQAGLSRRWTVEALENRDVRLFEQPKYAGRSDAEKRYAEVVEKALSRTGLASPKNVTDVTDVTDFETLEGGPEDVTAEGIGAQLLNDIEALLKTYVAYPSDHARTAHTLWIPHTHAMERWDSTPRLAFLSPEPSSGKSRALEVTDLLVPRPLQTINVTVAYLFRKMDDPNGLPTILFDEVDTIFGPKAKDHEEVRGLLNSGHRKGATSGRCVGPNQTPTEFPSYSAVALGGLGDLPDTILKRSIVIPMRRRGPKEKVKPFRQREAQKDGDALRQRIAAWARVLQHAPWPEMPEGIEDRDADVWEALLMVADAAGGDWPKRAREAAVFLTQAVKESTPSLGIRLLTDLWTVFGSQNHMTTDAILKALNALPEAPWTHIRKGEPLNANGLTSRLSKYGVKAVPVRFGPGPKDVARGYKRVDLDDVWDRYLPPSAKTRDVTDSTPSESEEDGPSGVSKSVTSVTSVTAPSAFERMTTESDEAAD